MLNNYLNFKYMCYILLDNTLLTILIISIKVVDKDNLIPEYFIYDILNNLNIICKFHLYFHINRIKLNIRYKPINYYHNNLISIRINLR